MENPSSRSYLFQDQNINFKELHTSLSPIPIHWDPFRLLFSWTRFSHLLFIFSSILFCSNISQFNCLVLYLQGVPKKMVHNNFNIHSESQNHSFYYFSHFTFGQKYVAQSVYLLGGRRGVTPQLDLLLKVRPPDGAAE